MRCFNFCGLKLLHLLNFVKFIGKYIDMYNKMPKKSILLYHYRMHSVALVRRSNGMHGFEAANTKQHAYIYLPDKLQPVRLAGG
jgi:hypothetical protein